MWWLFEKLEEHGDWILYAYSRECEDADGRIEVNRRTEEIRMLRPCKEDMVSAYAQEWSCDKVYRLIAEHYPDRRQIACG